mgnify:CR=1 FL=1
MEKYLTNLFEILKPYEKSKINLKAETLKDNDLIFEGGFLENIYFINTFDELNKLKLLVPEILKFLNSDDALYKSNTNINNLWKTGKCVFMIIKSVDKINQKIPEKYLKDIKIPILIDKKNDMKLTIKNSQNNLIFEKIY